MGNDCCGTRYAKATHATSESVPNFVDSLHQHEVDGDKEFRMASEVQPQEVIEQTEAAHVSANISCISSVPILEKSLVESYRLKSVETSK